MKVEWDKSLSVGIDAIDGDHQKLFQLINRLGAAETETPEELTAILNELVDYSEYHFGREEDLMEEKGYNRLEDHREEHGYFIAKLGDIGLQLESESLGVVKEEATEFLTLWLTSHIKMSDMEYVECVSGATKD